MEDEHNSVLRQVRNGTNEKFSKLKHVSASPGGQEIQNVKPIPRTSGSVGLRRGPRIFISSKYAGYANAAVPGATLCEPLRHGRNLA